MFYLQSHEMIRPGRFGREISGRKIGQWVYIGEDSAQRLSLEAAIGADIPRISLADLIDEISRDLRLPFLDWIGELSEDNSSADWWASEIAAKNPYYMLFARICLLSAARRIIRNGSGVPILIVCSPMILTREVQRILTEEKAEWEFLAPGWYSLSLPAPEWPLKSRIGMFLRTAPSPPRFLRNVTPLVHLLENNLAYRQKILQEQGFVANPFSGERTILFVTWADQRSVKNGPDRSVYADPYFGRLPEELKKLGYDIAFMTRVLPTAPFEKTVEALQKTNETLFFPEQFFRASDLSGCWKRAYGFSPAVAGHELPGCPFAGRLAQEHIKETRQKHTDSLIYESIVMSMSNLGVKPARIIYPCEGHAWENAMNHAIRRFLPGTKITGYENITFSRMVLSMFHSQRELNIRPYPDRLVTNGQLSTQILQDSQIPQDRIRTGCALRNQYYFSSGGNLQEVKSQAGRSPVRIVVATTINTSESVDLIAKAIRAFGKKQEYAVDIKCHPLSDMQTIRKLIGDFESLHNITFHETTPMNGLLVRARYVVYCYTTICFDALLYGAMPVWVRSENFINLDKLDSLPGIRRVASSAQDLFRIVSELEKMTPEEKEEWDRRAKDALRSAFFPINADSVQSFIL